MSERPPLRSLVAPLLVGAARVALGLLWLVWQGVLKYQAGFGASDILIVAHVGDSNTRVPWYFTAFAQATMDPAPALFGFAVPLVECALGVALILGVLTRPAAIASGLLLAVYWSSDQLIFEYPLMAALTVIVLAWPQAARVFSVSTVAERLSPRWRRIPQPLRAWL
jgi:thiosulfate dehydrogenase [quinone] large subunit